jgi:drug/metabolite transporter (DMT)-like permease
MSPLIPLAGSVALNAIAQLSLRHSTSVRKHGQLSAAKLWLGVWASSFAIATVLWVAAIRQADISYAYPMLGAGYVIVTLLAHFLLGERISTFRWVSILVITAGVVMVGVNR